VGEDESIGAPAPTAVKAHVTIESTCKSVKVAVQIAKFAMMVVRCFENGCEDVSSAVYMVPPSGIVVMGCRPCTWHV
jgi:hypothetical protein